jgi:hypothetical protein
MTTTWPEWRPINIAPKDRTILASSGPHDDFPRVVRWMKESLDLPSGWYDGESIYEMDYFSDWTDLPPPPRRKPT